MRRTRFHDALCPIARTSDLLADWWTPLILRDLFAGNNKFDELADALEISRGVLAARLKRLQEEGVLTREIYRDRPPRYEYRLTPKGLALWDVLAAMWRFGDDWMFEASSGGSASSGSASRGSAAVELFDKNSGLAVLPQTIDANTGEGLRLETTRVRLRVT